VGKPVHALPREKGILAALKNLGYRILFWKALPNKGLFKPHGGEGTEPRCV